MQSNTLKNSSNNILDLVFSNILKISVVAALEAIFDCDEHHHALDIEIPNFGYSILDTIEYIYDFKNANFDAISKYIMDSPFFNLSNFGVANIESHSSQFQIFLSNLLNQFVPKFAIKSHRFPKWFSKQLIAAIIRKKKYHKLYKMYNTSFYYNLFKKETTLCNKLIESDDTRYNNGVEEFLAVNSKSFFNFVNTISRNRDLPGVMHLDNDIADNGSDIANLFAKKFGSVYTNLDLTLTQIKFEILDCFSSLVFSESDVACAIHELDDSSSPGPDGVHPLLVKSCSEVFVPYLTKLFNWSISSGTFPLVWKTSFITPLFKSGDRSDVTNYRPIAKNCVFGKLIDKLVFDKISPYIFKFITPTQHGFTPFKSTQTNLCTYLEYISDSVNNKNIVDAIYTDLSRAFDVVNFDLLVRKLAAYGFHGSLLSWLRSFLCNRTQIVKIKNFTSNPIAVTSGVAQGSHLGPLFFILFINDLAQEIKYSKFTFFADDGKLYKCIKTLTDRNELQIDFDSLVNWCSANGFTCNPDKCCSITFGRDSLDKFIYKLNDTELRQVEVIKDLGVYIDSKLKFQFHIDYIASKAMRQVNFIKRFSRKFNRTETFRTLYFSFIYPILSYCSVVWRPHWEYQIKMLEKPRRSFIRFAAYKCGHAMEYTDHDYSNIAHTLKIPDIYSSMMRIDLIFGFKIVNSLIDCSELLEKFNFHVPKRILRHNSYFYNCEYHWILPTERISNLINTHLSSLDLYNSSLYSVTKKTRSLFNYL